MTRTHRRDGRRRAFIVAALAAGALAALAAGCSGSVSVGGGEPTLPAEEIERSISAQYAEQNPGITLEDLTCAEVEPEVGTTIECDARNSIDVDLDIAGEVTAVDIDDDSADYRWEVVRAVAPGTLYGDAAIEVVREQTDVAVAGLDCPIRIEVIAGARVNCDLRLADGSATAVILELTNQNGGFRVTGLPGPG